MNLEKKNSNIEKFFFSLIMNDLKIVLQNKKCVLKKTKKWVFSDRRYLCAKKKNFFTFHQWILNFRILDLASNINVGVKSEECCDLKMVFLEDPKMIFTDMRLHATSTPTSTPTRFHHHHRKYRAQNNNDCTNFFFFKYSHFF